MFPSPGNLANPGIEPRSHTLQVDSIAAEPQGSMANSLLNIILSGEKLKAFPLGTKNKTDLPTLTTFTHHCTGSLSHNNQTKKKNKRNQNCKGKVKLPLFADNLILYMDNAKDSTKKC